MYFDGEYRHLGTIDVRPLADAVEALGEDAWFEDVERQATYRIHRHTQTIPLLYDHDLRHRNPTRLPRYDQLEPVLAPALDVIACAIRPALPAGGQGYFVRVILTRLSPGTVIRPHRDQGVSLSRAHRCHMAIHTHEDVRFGVDDDDRHLAPGEIWEINNRKPHYVRNHSDVARVHLIADYVVPGERILDPEGLLIA